MVGGKFCSLKKVARESLIYHCPAGVKDRSGDDPFTFHFRPPHHCDSATMTTPYNDPQMLALVQQNAPEATEVTLSTQKNGFVPFITAFKNNTNVTSVTISIFVQMTHYMTERECREYTDPDLMLWGSLCEALGNLESLKVLELERNSPQTELTQEMEDEIAERYSTILRKTQQIKTLKIWKMELLPTEFPHWAFSRMIFIAQAVRDHPNLEEFSLLRFMHGYVTQGRHISELERSLASSTLAILLQSLCSVSNLHSVRLFWQNELYEPIFPPIFLHQLLQLASLRQLELWNYHNPLTFNSWDSFGQGLHQSQLTELVFTSCYVGQELDTFLDAVGQASSLRRLRIVGPLKFPL